MQDKTNQTTTVLRPAAFASRQPVALKCALGAFSPDWDGDTQQF
jgi:hypothetical protein